MSRKEIITFILALTLSRLVVNIGRRFAYPFLPEISRQLSVPLSDVQNVLAGANGVGVASPLFGPLSDRYGRKRVIAAGLIGAGARAAALLPRARIVGEDRQVF